MGRSPNTSQGEAIIRDEDSDFDPMWNQKFRTLYDQALMSKRLEDRSKAINLMMQAIEVKEAQDFPRLYRQAVQELALMYKEKGNLEEAVRYFQIALDYGSGQAAYELALIHKGNEEWEKAEELFKTAISYGYEQNSIYVLARMYKETGRREQAVEWIHRMLNTVSHKQEAEFFLTKIQAEGGDVDAQIALANLYLIRGGEYEEQGEICPYFDEGEDYNEQALYWMTKAAEKSINAKHNVALMHKRMGNIDETIKWMKKAAREGSSHSNPGDEHFRIIAQYELYQSGLSF